MADLANILRFEELTINTAPALAEAHIDGWVARASGSQTVRSNAASFLQAAPLANVPFASTYERICQWYAHTGQAPAFRISPLTDPVVQPFLLSQGFVAQDDTLFMTLDLAAAERRADDPQSAPHLGQKLIAREIAEILAEIHTAKGITGAEAEREIERQRRWRGPERGVVLRSINGTLSLGMARVQGEYLGLFNLRTTAAHQGRGYAQQVLEALLSWGEGEGARVAFLQVDATNARAVRLYERNGFLTRYVYQSLLKAK